MDNARLFREATEQATIHVQLNEALRSAVQQLERELHTREEFLASASHDLKNPIASIKGNAQLALRRLDNGRDSGPEAMRNAFERIVFVATRAAMQVDELLDSARIQMGRTLVSMAIANAPLVALEISTGGQRKSPPRVIV